jgi:MarR family transcriptional regulator, organic hydroperoxide resistance regulator
VIDEHGPDSLILELQRATHAILHALAVRLTDLDLNASEINVLANLADGRSRSIGELSTDTATKPTTLTSVLDRLERKGHVTRDLDPADRRSFRVSLTPGGRRVAAASREAMHDLEAAALATISPADVAGFRTVTSALTKTDR